VADVFPLDGYYTIEKTGTGWPISNSITADHTPDAIDGGNGYFMLVNASYGTDEFYRKRVTGLIPGQTYTLSFWSANISPSLPVIPNITFGIASVNTGNFIGSVSTGNITSATWEQHTFTFIAGTTEADMVIRNNGIGGKGNDLVIDDISLSQLCLLPFKLLAFNAAANNHEPLLNWQTAAEYNTAGFTVERSSDGKHYTAINQVTATGNAGINNYSFTDKNMPAGIVYYRLRITSKDNRISYSETRVLTTAFSTNNNILVYPNPVQSIAQVIIPGVTDENSSIKLYNEKGQWVKTIPTGGQQAVSIDTAPFSKGIYLLQLVKDDRVLYSTRFIKQ